MKWINDVRVSIKILALAVIAAVALLSVGYTGYSMLQASNYRMSKMYNQKLKNVQMVSELKYFMRDMQVHELNLADSADPAVQEKNRKTIESINDRFHQTLDAYEENSKGLDGVEERVQTIEASWEKLYQTGRKIDGLVKEGKMDEARALYYDEGQKNSSAVGNPVKELLELINTNAEEVYQRNLEKAAEATRNMLIEGIVALIVLVVVAQVIGRGITSPLYEMKLACERLRDGDFRESERRVVRGDEFGEMAATVAEMRTSIGKLMRGTNDSAQQIAAASEELTASSSQSAQASDQVAQSVQRAASAVTQQENEVQESSGAVASVSTAVDKMQDQAMRVAAHASEAYDRAASGGKAIAGSVQRIQGAAATVRQSSQIVDKLGENSKEIGKIVETISGIAEQTNLLALNAAIEAARAGEAGRGFSVVADEVRKLAEESAEAAQRITSLIESIQRDTDAAVASMKDGSEAVGGGASSVEQLKEIFDEIRVFVDGVSREAQAMAGEIQNVNTQAGAISAQVQQVEAQGHTVASEMENVSAATEEQSASASEIAGASECRSVSKRPRSARRRRLRLRRQRRSRQRRKLRGRICRRLRR